MIGTCVARCKLWTCSSLNGGSKLWAWNNNFNVTRLKQHCRVNKKRSPLPGPRSSFCTHQKWIAQKYGIGGERWSFSLQDYVFSEAAIVGQGKRGLFTRSHDDEVKGFDPMGIPPELEQSEEPIRNPPIDNANIPDGFMDKGDMEREKIISETQLAVRKAFERADFKVALEASRALRDLCKTHFSDGHPVYASALNNVGLAHKYLGEPAFAVEAYSEALRVYKKVFGKEEHLSFAMTLANCGLAFRAMAETFQNECEVSDKMDMLEYSEKNLFRALEIREKLLGPGHKLTELVRSELASLHASMDKEQKAEDGLRYALEQLQKKGVKNTIELATATSNLGHFLRRHGRYDEAVLQYQKSLNIREELLGTDHWRTEMARNGLDSAQKHQNRGSS